MATRHKRPSHHVRDGVRLRMCPYGARVQMGQWDFTYGYPRGCNYRAEFFVEVAIKAKARRAGRREIEDQRRDGEEVGDGR